MPARRRPSWKEARALIRRDDRKLLIMRAPDPCGDPRWNLPGGRIRDREPPADAVRRCCHEHLGLCVTVAASQPPVTVHFGTHAVEVHCLLCRIETHRPASPAPAELRWVLPGQLREYYFEQSIQPVIDWITAPQ